MKKPEIPDLALLERYRWRYRRWVEQGNEEVARRVRRGRMERVHFSALAGRYSWIWFDAYGVLNRGDEPVPGAGDTLRRLRMAGVPFRLVSNNASHSLDEIRENLRRMGIDVLREEIITSGLVVSAFVRRNGLEGLPYVWIGGGESAVHYAPDPERLMVNRPGSLWRPDAARYALFSGNQEYYGGVQEQMLHAAMAREDRGPVPFLLVNADLVAPEPSGGVNLVAGYTACSVNDAGRHPMLGVGKPFSPVFHWAWACCGRPPWERVLMVGDALETDILGAAALGMATCLTLTGLYGPMAGELDNVCDRLEIRPDFIVPGIG
ncbi:MAG: HAD-IIA family hydrolase [Magnetococcales bacterium]|nr:HAD-IIA family hydrolase [Magnetococcales bacterium]